jgi:hypothetical protein
MRPSLTLTLPFVLVAILGAAVPAAAHDWLGEWRSMRAEYQAEFDRARMLGGLDCTGRAAYVAEQNRLTNQRIHAEYHRSLPRTQAESAATGMSTPPRPTLAPPGER